MRVKTIIIILKALKYLVERIHNIEQATTNLSFGGHLYLDKQLEIEIEHYSPKPPPKLQEVKDEV